MAAADFTALVERIREVLTEGAAGTIRRCPPKGTFRWSTGRVAAQAQPPSAGDTPTVCVEFLEVRDGEGSPANELADWWIVEVDLGIDVVYPFGGGNYLRPPSGGDRHSLTVRAANDLVLIRAALCTPNNLSDVDRGTTTGTETGLVSGLLEYRQSTPDWQESTLVVRHTFLARVQIEAPT